MALELSLPDSDGDRIDELFGKTVQWGQVQTILMLTIILTMTGFRANPRSLPIEGLWTSDRLA